MGVEIFTIGGDGVDSCWSTVEDCPFPIFPGVVVYFKGSLYLRIWYELVERPPQEFLRFNLENETFSLMCYPELLQPKGKHLDLIELCGELCVAQCLAEQIDIWMLRSDDGHEWVKQYVIRLPDAWNFEVFSVMPNDVKIIRWGSCLYHYDDAQKDTREMVRLDRLRYMNSKVDSFDFVGQEIFLFNILPYVESLIPVTKKRHHSLAK